MLCSSNQNCFALEVEDITTKDYPNVFWAYHNVNLPWNLSEGGKAVPIIQLKMVWGENKVRVHTLKGGRLEWKIPVLLQKRSIDKLCILQGVCSQQFENHTLFCLRAPFSFMWGQSFPVTTAFISATGTALKRNKSRNQKMSYCQGV